MTASPQADGTPPLTQAQRRELMRRAHGLKALITVGKQGLTPGLLEQIRQSFAATDLLKIRLSAEDRGAAQTEAALLAEKAVCQLLRCIGRVAVLYRPGSPPKKDKG